MDQQLFDFLFWGVFVGGGILFVAFAFIMAARQYKRDIAKQKESGSNHGKTSNEQESATIRTKATVADQMCYVNTTGIKVPKTVKEFVVVFQTENNEILKWNVPEEMYDGFEKGQSGILTIVDGELYGFHPEEADILF